MKAIALLLGAVAAAGLLVFLAYQGTYNGLVVKREAATAAVAKVKNVCQRQADLIPNLAKAVKAYDAHEAEVLEGVAKARSGMNVSDSALLTDPNAQKQLVEAQRKIQGAINVVMEKYPALKADSLHRDLMRELAGSQNRISTERDSLIEKVNDYNATQGGLITQTFMASKFPRLSYPEFSQGDKSSVEFNL